MFQCMFNAYLMYIHRQSQDLSRQKAIQFPQVFFWAADVSNL